MQGKNIFSFWSDVNLRKDSVFSLRAQTIRGQTAKEKGEFTAELTFLPLLGCNYYLPQRLRG